MGSTAYGWAPTPSNPVGAHTSPATKQCAAPPPPRPPRCPTRVGSLTHHVRNCVYTHCWMPHATWERREGGQPRVVACCVGGCGGWPPLLDILNSVATPPWHPSPPPSPRSPPMDSTLCGTIIRSYRGAMRWPHPPARARGNQAYCHVWACWGAQSNTTHRRPPNARPSRPLDPGPTLCPSAHDCILDCVYSQGLGRLAKPRPTSAQVAHPGHHQSECAAVCSANTRGTSRTLVEALHTNPGASSTLPPREPHTNTLKIAPGRAPPLPHHPLHGLHPSARPSAATNPPPTPHTPESPPPTLVFQGTPVSRSHPPDHDRTSVSSLFPPCGTLWFWLCVLSCCVHC